MTRGRSIGGFGRRYQSARLAGAAVAGLALAGGLWWVFGLSGVPAARADAAATPVHVQFSGTGAWHEDAGAASGGTATYSADDKIQWTVTYDTTLNADGSLASANGLLVGGVGSWTYTTDEAAGGNLTCSGDLQPPTAQPQFSSQLLAGAGLQILVESIGPIGADTSACSNPGEVDPQYVPFQIAQAFSHVANVLDAVLPAAMTAKFTVPAATFTSTGSGYVSQQVSDADAAVPLTASDCVEQGNCTLHWTGTVTIGTECNAPDGQITSVTDPVDNHELTATERDGIGLSGNNFSSGQTIDLTGYPHGVQITLADGSVIRSGLGSMTVGNCAADFTPTPPTTGRAIKLLLGSGWAWIVDAIGGMPVDVDTERGSTGTRGTSYEVWASAGAARYHLIEGAIDVTNENGSTATTVSPVPGDYVTIGSSGPPRITGHDTGAPASCGETCAFPTNGPLPGCKAPRLIGLTDAKAVKVLAVAHCALGKTQKPKVKKGHKQPRLVVRAQKPAPGSKVAAGATIELTLGPKPPKKSKH